MVPMSIPSRVRFLAVLSPLVILPSAIASSRFAPADQAPVPGKPGRLVIVGGNLNGDNKSVYQSILDGRLGSGPLCVFPTAGGTPQTGMASPVATFDKHGGAGTAMGVLISSQKPETARDPKVVEQIKSCSGFFF